MQKGAQVDSKNNVSILFILKYLEKSILLYNYYHSSYALNEIHSMQQTRDISQYHKLLW